MDPLIQSGVALITGAGSGLGRHIALAFARHGCRKFVLADVSEEGMKETDRLVQEIDQSAQVKIQITDVSNSASVQEMVACGVNTFGRIDFSCHNAGLGQGGTKTADMTSQYYDRLCNVNEKGVFLCEKYVIGQMLNQSPLFPEDIRHVRGSIVNTASLSGTSALPELSAYNASKHAVVVLTRVDARQYASQRIRINSVSPGFVMTPMMAGSGLSEGYYNSIKVQAPMNRLTEADEVAETVVWLSSSWASGVTGTNIPVDVGASLFHVV